MQAIAHSISRVNQARTKEKGTSILTERQPTIHYISVSTRLGIQKQENVRKLSSGVLLFDDRRPEVDSVSLLTVVPHGIQFTRSIFVVVSFVFVSLHSALFPLRRKIRAHRVYIRNTKHMFRCIITK